MSLDVSRAKTDIPLGAQAIDTTMDTVTLHLQEQVSTRWQVGLVGGAQSLTQSGYDLTQGMSLDGYHAGVSARGVLLQGERSEAFLSVTYMYYRSEDTLDGQTAELRWHQIGARLGGRWRLGRVALSAGASQGLRDGQERAHGIVNRTRDFRDSETGAFGGVEFEVDPGGYIGINAESGLDQRVRLQFRRDFF